MLKTEIEADLKKQLKALLDGGQAHAKLDDAVADFPFALQGARRTICRTPPGSCWSIFALPNATF